ncbi:MAG: Major facilitator transporter [Polaromonas sp.]|nr:Major facilitator transporter [Polaromonas sp.]
MNSTSPSEPSAPQPVPQGSWYALVVLTLIYACHYLDRSIISIVAEPIRREFGLSDSQLGLLTGLAWGVSFALAGLPFGYLSDRVNRRRLLATVVVTWSSMTALAGMAQSYATLLVTRVLLGAAEAGGSPTAMSMISDLFPARLRSTALGIYYLGAGIGAAASALIGALVAMKYGWRAAFLVAGLPGILLGLLVWFTLRDVPRGATEVNHADVPAPPAGAVFRFMFSQRAVLSLFVAVSMVSAGMAAIGAWLPALLMRSHAMSLGHAGLATALTFGLFGSLGTLVGGIVADRLARHGAARRLWFCAAMALIAVPAGLGATLSPSVSVAVGLAFVTAFSGFSIFPSGFGMAMELMPPQMRGMTMASAQVVTNLVGYGVGPFAVGLLSTSIGGADSLRQGMALVCAATMAAAALALVLAVRWHAKAAVRNAGRRAEPAVAAP